MLKYVQLFMLVVNFVRENPDFVAKLREIVNAIKDHIGGGENVAALGQDAFIESLADRACGIADGQVVANAVALERRQWLELIRLIFENWDKIAPIFFKE